MAYSGIYLCFISGALAESQYTDLCRNVNLSVNIDTKFYTNYWALMTWWGVGWLSPNLVNSPAVKVRGKW